MGSYNVKPGRIPFPGYPESDHGRIIPGHIVALPGAEFPLPGLFQLLKTLFRKCLLYIFHRVKAGGALLYKCQHFPGTFLIFFHNDKCLSQSFYRL